MRTGSGEGAVGTRSSGRGIDQTNTNSKQGLKASSSSSKQSHVDALQVPWQSIISC
jgi:hypothetical protein